jgi:hypothetical protein
MEEIIKLKRLEKNNSPAIDYYYPETFAQSLVPKEGEQIFWSSTSASKVGFIGPSNGRVIPISIDCLEVTRSNQLDYEKVISLLQWIKSGKNTVLFCPRLNQIKLIKEKDQLKIGVKIVDGHHRIFACILAGIETIWFPITQHLQSKILTNEPLYKSIRLSQLSHGVPLFNRKSAATPDREVRGYQDGKYERNGIKSQAPPLPQVHQPLQNLLNSVPHPLDAPDSCVCWNKLVKKHEYKDK